MHNDINDINALRKSLFDVLDGLKSGNIKIDQAKAINETAQVLINIAKVEVDYMRVSNKEINSGLMITLSNRPAIVTNKNDSGTTEMTANGHKTVTPTAGGSVTTHRIR